MKANELEDLKVRLADFASRRDWDQFHSPKNLSMALIAEAAELVEIFQWLSEEQSQNLSAKQQTASEQELADIFIYLIRIADKLNVNLYDAALKKININEQRYPENKVKGDARRAEDYTE